LNPIFELAESDRFRLADGLGFNVRITANTALSIHETAPNAAISLTTRNPPLTLRVTDQLGNPIQGVSFTTASGAIVPVNAAPGDFNFNDRVDAADFVVWRDTLGTPETFNMWRANFGKTAANSSTASTVPEAASLLYCLAALATLLGRRVGVMSSDSTPCGTRIFRLLRIATSVVLTFS
jgi:hypothetical protein